MARNLLIFLFACGALAGCSVDGRPVSLSHPPAHTAPGVAGLERAVNAAHAAVSKSAQDAKRAARTAVAP